jgi:hypothetical protein
MTNDLVITRALQGKTYDNGGQAFHTQHIDYPGQWIGGAGHSWMSRRLSDILSTRNHSGHVTQVILSYNTVIAWLDGDVWIVPDARYSQTTSSRHQPRLHKLTNVRRIPNDCGPLEYAQVLSGAAVYTPGYGSKLGTYRAA